MLSLLLLRRCPSYGVWNTEENGASKSFPVDVYDMACCSFSIDLFTFSSSCCCIIVTNSPSVMIMFSILSRFYTSSSSIHWSAKASWVSLYIAVFSSVGLKMAIAAYNSWGEIIYHFFGTDLLRSIFVLFSAVSFEKLSSLWYINAERIASLSVADQHLSIYRDVTLTLYMVRNVNVNINVDLCLTLSCELVGRLPNIKRWKLSTAHMPGRWRGGRWSEKCQLGRCTNQRWGAQARTHQHSDFLTSLISSLTPLFLRLENSRCELMR